MHFLSLGRMARGWLIHILGSGHLNSLLCGLQQDSLGFLGGAYKVSACIILAICP